VNTESASGGFEYSDAYLHDNDARFVFKFVRSAMDYGCVTANYVEAMNSVRDGNLWETPVTNQISGESFLIRSKVVVNASGPFVDQYNQLTEQATKHRHVFSKGIHLIVDRLTPHKRVLTFFANDGRLFFVIPMGPKTCIGTTDTRVESVHAHVTAEDRKFVLDNINARLNLPIPLVEEDIVAERCGVRPLVVEKGSKNNKDWMQLSRKHAIDINHKEYYLSVLGGKLTDCINVGDEIYRALVSMGIDFPYPGKKWYGEPSNSVKEEFFHQARLMDLDAMTHHSSSEKLTSRLWRRYGSHAISLLETIRADPREAELLIENAEYLRCEIELAAKREMITKLEDFLRRRSKIALVVRKEDIRKASGLVEACKILFGDQAEEKMEEYFQTH